MRLLLDTCVLSELQKPGRSSSVVAFFDGLPDHLLHISVVTLGEIAKGIALLPDGQRKSRLFRWRVTLIEQYDDRILPVDQETAEWWGEITAAGQKRGVTVPAADGLIAATALQHGLSVVTRNASDFEAAGAAVVNPWLSASSV